MKAGLRLGAVMCLLAGAGQVGLGVLLPMVLGVGNIFMFVGLGVGALVCLVIGVGLWIFAGKAGVLVGDTQLLATGQPATAVIQAVRDTGITLQHGVYAIIDFDLLVTPAGGSPYPVRCRSSVPRISLSMVGVGKTLSVRVDIQNPELVAIDWNAARV